MTPADYAADIAKALEAGPTEGPWHQHHDKGRLYIENENDEVVCDMGLRAKISPTSNYIAACHPVAMRPILESLDQSAIAVQMLTGEVERLRADLEVANAHLFAALSADEILAKALEKVNGTERISPMDMSNLLDVASANAQDAKRYRLMRRGQQWSVIDGIGDVLRAEQLDAAIDAALKDTK